MIISNASQIDAPKKKGDVGFDIRSHHKLMIEAGRTVTVSTGLAIALPEWMTHAEIAPRSSMSNQGVLCHRGIIDQGYRGIIGATLTNLANRPIFISAGERIAQLLFWKEFGGVGFPRLVEGTVTDDTDRGEAGFGSTGKE